ncbi:MAG: M20/M25/M40 family metallo-hydrolase [Candidatus Cloacimonetes bacterium]|jgi:tripeptide aminopeptidase|nr:M20/M25/M40 family metallo-hydrolase [Candidatus Cloacimonadota bacterium]
MQDDVVKYFLELISIDSESGNERAIIDHLTSDLKVLGAKVEEDDAYVLSGGNAGNLYAQIPGNIDKKPILFCVHCDTVKPGKGIKPIISDGIIRSDGTTILGSDDKSGIAELFTAIKDILENEEKHPPMEILITVSEEVGLLGAKHFDKTRLKSALGYALDAHQVEELVIGAPAQNSIQITFFGKESHAGVEPEKGINAIRVAAEAITTMPIGRIDHETTSNIGLIKGGIATNIVPNKVEVKGEARSHNRSKLDQVTADIHHCIEQAVQHYQYDFGGASFDWKVNLEYEAFYIPDSEPVVQLAIDAMHRIGLTPKVVIGGGGSDANIINASGLPMIICGTGMNKVHTLDEEIEIEQLLKGKEFLKALIQRYAEL